MLLRQTEVVNPGVWTLRLDSGPGRDKVRMALVKHVAFSALVPLNEWIGTGYAFGQELLQNHRYREALRLRQWAHSRSRYHRPVFSTGYLLCRGLPS